MKEPRTEVAVPDLDKRAQELHESHLNVRKVSFPGIAEGNSERVRTKWWMNVFLNARDKKLPGIGARHFGC